MAGEVDYGPPRNCNARALGSGTISEPLLDYVDRTGDIMGSKWGDSRPAFTQFHMVLPPNRPNCAAATDWSDWIVANASLVTASSNHTGGVNLAMCDGAVRFVSDSVDAGDQGYAPWGDDVWGCIDNPGAARIDSQYGVWGAFGSKAGGESKSL